MADQTDRVGPVARGTSDARADPARRAVVWVVFDPVHQEYMAGVPGRGWMATRERAHATEWADEVSAARILEAYWHHRASAFAAKSPPYYSV